MRINERIAHDQVVEMYYTDFRHLESWTWRRSLAGCISPLETTKIPLSGIGKRRLFSRLDHFTYSFSRPWIGIACGKHKEYGPYN
ncbi:MAG: hypothetical protein BWX52_01846 [Bacteroidetes bacterium ADurb.Bin013]|nr:MAG: hypothetical protein BWX52_01846 [Bacteroidetes bacterium ADurb.Bin013]